MNTQYMECEDGGKYVVKTGLSEFVSKADDGSDAPIVLLVSDESEDSDGDIIRQRKSKEGPGWELGRFNKGPVITWVHDMWRPNMSGPNTKAIIGDHPKKGAALFLNPLQMDEGDMFAMEIEGKIRRDVLKESSVGFRTTHFRPLINDDTGRRKGIEIFGAELFEVAIANRGANPNTEVMAKRMLSRPGVADGVEGAGSKEIGELKELIAHMGDEIKTLSDALCQLGDKVDGEELAKMVEMRAHAQNKQKDLNNAAGALLASMKTEGTAHGS